MQFLNDLGLVVEMWGAEIAIASHGRHGSIRGGMACRHPSHKMTWGNNESVETSLSGGRENMCGRKKFNFARFGAGVTKSSALALRLSRISEGPDKLLIFLVRIMIVFAYLPFSIPAIF
jgi:hypothetical protein